jgi:hypothetical protein
MSLLFGLPHLSSFISHLSIFHNTPNPSEFSPSRLILHNAVFNNSLFNVFPLEALTSPTTLTSSPTLANDNLNPFDIFFLSPSSCADSFTPSSFSSFLQNQESPALPNFRATLSFEKSNFISSFQSEIFCFPSKSSCLAFVPSIPSIRSLSILLLCCGGVPGVTGFCDIYQFHDRQKSHICSSPVKLLHSNLVHLPCDVYGSEICIQSSSHAIIPIILAQSANGQLIVEHTHPIGSFFAPGHRRHAAVIKHLWL